MADPFTIAVSVAGLASLGLQLADTLNKYAGSAVDSKDRAQAIREDINLAVQVFKTLETTVRNDANRAMMNDDSQKLVKEHVKQCETIFFGIQKILPRSDAKSIRTRDLIRWPLVEPKLELLRGNLEKVKTTLQILINVIILAAMSEGQIKQDELDRQRFRIQELLEEKASREARVEKLEDHAHTPAALPSNKLRVRSIPTESEFMVNIAVKDIPSSFETATQCVSPSTPGHGDRNPGNHSHIIAQQPTSITTIPAQDANKSPPAGQNIVPPSQEDSKTEEVMITLHDDYTACLRQLRTLQSRLEMTLDKMFIPTTGVPMANPEHDAIARAAMARSIDKSVRETRICFEQRIFGSGAHRTTTREDVAETNASVAGSNAGYGIHDRLIKFSLDCEASEKPPGKLQTVFRRFTHRSSKSEVRAETDTSASNHQLADVQQSALRISSIANAPVPVHSYSGGSTVANKQTGRRKMPRFMTTIADYMGTPAHGEAHMFPTVPGEIERIYMPINRTRTNALEVPSQTSLSMRVRPTHLQDASASNELIDHDDRYSKAQTSSSSSSCIPPENDMLAFDLADDYGSHSKPTVEDLLKSSSRDADAKLSGPFGHVSTDKSSEYLDEVGTRTGRRCKLILTSTISMFIPDLLLGKYEDSHTYARAVILDLIVMALIALARIRHSLMAGSPFENPRYNFSPHSGALLSTASGEPFMYASTLPAPMPRYDQYGRPYGPPTPMTDQSYTRPAPSVDSSYGRERQFASPNVDRNALRRKVDATFAKRSGRDESHLRPRLSPPRTIIDPELDNDTATNTSGLVTVEDLLRRWTHLNPDSVDSAADLGN
ncbi:hypothetical protein D6C93_05274 [Aureobasidium pullulans]|nr:hypothetical protein D6C93_05274 [Aureobasidium pullulans]